MIKHVKGRRMITYCIEAGTKIQVKKSKKTWDWKNIKFHVTKRYNVFYPIQVIFTPMGIQRSSNNDIKYALSSSAHYAFSDGKWIAIVAQKDVKIDDSSIFYNDIDPLWPDDDWAYSK